MRAGMPSVRDRGGFTLIELLAVLIIVAIVSAVALPTVLSALAHRQVSESGRVLQGALVGARDRAIHDAQPSGIRLLPDPVFFHGSAVVGKDKDGNPITVPAPLRLADGTIDPAETLAYNRAVPIGPAPEYSEGLVTVRRPEEYARARVKLNVVTDPTGVGNNGVWPTLILEEAPRDAHGVPNPPTSWMWNVRVGDRLQLNGAGPLYTVVGPMWVGPAAGNSEMFVNVGMGLGPGSPGPLGVDYLLLVNGRDDNANGFADEGWDGLDNNSDGLVDEHMPGQVITSPVDPNRKTTRDEWELEAWHAGIAAGATSIPYVIRRRPLPGPNARELALPTQMVIDLARSQLPADRYTGMVDLLILPDGTATPSLPYGAPSSIGMGASWYHFALLSRADVGTGNDPKEGWSVLSLNGRTGQAVTTDEPDPKQPFVYALRGGR